MILQLFSVNMTSSGRYHCVSKHKTAGITDVDDFPVKNEANIRDPCDEVVASP